jgi:hypothetical protein
MTALSFGFWIWSINKPGFGHVHGNLNPEEGYKRNDFKVHKSAVDSRLEGRKKGEDLRCGRMGEMQGRKERETGDVRC